MYTCLKLFLERQLCQPRSSYQSVEFYRPSKKSQNQNQYSQIDPSSRFGIGTAFQGEVQSTPAQPAVPDGTNTVPAPATGPIYTPPPYPTPLRCDLCGVSANRQDQLETHKRGARHLRMLRMNGLPVPEPGQYFICNLLYKYQDTCTYNIYDIYDTCDKNPQFVDEMQLSILMNKDVH